MSIVKYLYTHRNRWIPLMVALFLGLGIVSVGAAAPPQQTPDEGAAVFAVKCAACHTIGGGPLAGPDLEGVVALRDRDWLERWLAEPDKMLAEGDPLALQLLAEYNNVPMPNMGLSQAEVVAVIAYMQSLSAAPTDTQPAAGDLIAAAPTPEAPAGDPVRGGALFSGTARLQNGGPACLSCHSLAGIAAQGGALGPDLTPAFAKFGGDAGMAAVLADLPFPTMRPVYGNRPLTAGEQADLLAVMQTLAGRPSGAARSTGWQPAAWAGGGFVALMTLLQVVWRQRLRGVRRSLQMRKGMTE